MTNRMNSSFRRGSDNVFRCSCCGRNTRGITTTDSPTCSQCWDIAGAENELSDNGELNYTSPKDVIGWLNAAVKHGGNKDKLRKSFETLVKYVKWEG